MKNLKDTHFKTISYGSHIGTLYTRLPSSYLRHLVNSKNDNSGLCEAELKRRGSFELPEMELTPHAINKASLRCFSVYAGTRHKNEGMHSWLVRMAKKAMESGEMSGDKYVYKRMKFVIDKSQMWPVVKSVM